MDEKTLACFMAYDIRGKVPDDLNDDIVYKVGRAYSEEMEPKGAVAVGYDVRQTSKRFSEIIIDGLTDSGIDVVDIGMCGTEMVYYASSLEGMDGGIMVTASHNPKEYNGLKLVRGQGKPISADTGLMDIEKRVRTGNISEKKQRKGSVKNLNVMSDYTQKILSFVKKSNLKPLTIIANPGNGCAGPALDSIAKNLPFKIHRINFNPDGNFPNGIPNPLLTENRSVTSDAVKELKADFGVAWDGDFDRCFIFDETGSFIEGYYLVGFLAKRLLEKNPGSKVVHDPRLVWNTLEVLEDNGGVPVISKSGHSFIKEKMRETNAVYGGEMSAHHYFRDFTFCDSGMIPWLLIAEEISTTGKKLSELVSDRVRKFPCSGEINRKVKDAGYVLKYIENHYKNSATSISEIDGISMEFSGIWRFNLRKSNTEPVVRLNLESAGDIELMKNKTVELLALIDNC